MSASWDLQTLVYNTLQADVALAALLPDAVDVNHGGKAIYDRAPEGEPFPRITFGPSDVVPEDYECITAREETLEIDIWSRHDGGYKEAKKIADTVKDALHEQDFEPDNHALVEMHVTGIRHFRDPDGLTSHGVVTLRALIEEV